MALMALGWGLFAGGAGMIGALIAWFARPSHRVIGLATAFGCGVLLSLAAFELFDGAFVLGGFLPASIGFVAGAGVFAVALGWLDRRGAGHRRRSAVNQIAARDSASMVALGTLLDGIPKALVIGVGFYAGEGVGMTAVAGVFLANVPESLGSVTRMRTIGRSGLYVFAVWGLAGLATGLAALLGYLLLGDVGPEARAFLKAFAGGAFIVSVVDGLIPQIFDETRDLAGFVTALGFLAGYSLSHVLA